MAEPSRTLLEAIAVTAEVMGTTLSPAAARVFAHDLAEHDDASVLAALVRVRREVRGRLTVADVISRIDDGRPGPEEAWAMMPRDEATTVVWTDEMSEAWGRALPLLDAGDAIAARMAFLETYRAAVVKARADKRQAKWRVSPGTDVEQRRLAIEDAVKRGRLGAQSLALAPPATHGEALGLTTMKKITDDVEARIRAKAGE